jgi:hypothetical protein
MHRVSKKVLIPSDLCEKDRFIQITANKGKIKRDLVSLTAAQFHLFPGIWSSGVFFFRH